MTTMRQAVDEIIRSIGEMLLKLGCPDDQVENACKMLDAADEVLLSSTYLVEAVAPDGTTFGRLATLDAEARASLAQDIREMGGRLSLISLRDLAQREWDQRWGALRGAAATTH